MANEENPTPSVIPVRVLYFQGCPNHPPTVERVRAVAERIRVLIALDEVEVATDDDANALGFRGSPTVQVRGADLDPAERGRDDCGFGCRTYRGAGVPDDAMIEAALRNPPLGGDRTASAEP